MRILLVNYEYPPLGGGGGVLTRTLAAELARRHSVTVLTSRASGLPEESFDDGVHVVRVGVVGRRELARASMASLLSFVPAALRAGARLIGGATFDVVNSIFAVPSGSAGGPLARRAAAPHVLTLIGGDIFDPSRRISADRFPPLRATVGRVVRAAGAVTAISRDVARRAADMTGRRDIIVVPCAVEPPKLPRPDRESLGWSRGDVVVLTIARLVDRKGLDTLIGAVGRAGPPLRLEVVGDGPNRARLEALASSVAPGRVSFSGTLDAGGKALRLASADAFALVSLHEGFGLVYLEAMHAGLPVVAGTAGGQIDFLDDGANALLVPPGDVAALSTALRRIAADPGMRRSLAGEARRTVAAYTPERMAAQYTDVYERAAG
jgi:glycosyltransferase involved in cell wall biosynthesis